MNFIETRKREHSRKPDEIYPLIEACSPGPFIELFARASEQAGLFPCRRQQWTRLGDEAESEFDDQQKLARFDEREQFDDGGEPWIQTP